jgi:DNA-binding transcriptional MerR regulator
MAKAAEAFRTISEVADDLGIQKHVLRFWEVKFNQIRPMKRGGGRRYYRPEDMELLRGIRQLLHRDGYTIKGVQKILREQGVDAVKDKSRSDDELRLAEAPAPAAPMRAAPAEAGSRGKTGRKTPLPATGKARKAAAAPTDRRSVVNAVIAELIECRNLLGGEKGSSRTAKSPRGARRSA